MLHFTAVSSVFVSPFSLAFTYKPARRATGLTPKHSLNAAWTTVGDLEISFSCWPGSLVPTSLKDIFNPSISQMFWYKTWKNPIFYLSEALHRLYASQRRSFVIYSVLTTLGQQENVYLNNLGYVHMNRLKISLDVGQYHIQNVQFPYCSRLTPSLPRTQGEKRCNSSFSCRNVFGKYTSLLQYPLRGWTNLNL